MWEKSKIISIRSSRTDLSTVNTALRIAQIVDLDPLCLKLCDWRNASLRDLQHFSAPDFSFIISSL